MSTADWTQYVDPKRRPTRTKAQARMSFDAYPPHLERLIGVWKVLARAPLRGITADGTPVAGLFDRSPDDAPVAAATAAATRWLDSLPPEIRTKSVFPVDSDLWRYWQNTPLLLRDPQVELVELAVPLREMAMEVVRVSLSAEGHRRTREVMDNNLFLGRLLDATHLMNEWSFTLSIFGEPSTTQPWGWQLFGHHLALNCLFIDGRMVLSPVFMGLEPDHESGPTHRRVFLPHEERALTMIRSLTDGERAQAVLHSSMLTAEQPPGRYHPDDGRQVGGAFQDNRVVPYEGVNVGALGAAQRRKLLELAELFICSMPDGPAGARMRELERYLESTWFAWIGPSDDVNPFYFRIHSPVALIEFDHHSGIFLANQEPARFHVHTLVRQPNGGDYGLDLLRQHYANGGHQRDTHDHGEHHHDGHDAHSHDGGKTFHKHE